MDFIGGLPPEREKYMSKKLKKQSVYSVADLESLKEFTVDEVKSDSRGLNVTMKLVNKAGSTTRNRRSWNVQTEGCILHTII